jgi:hypothetical protein
LWFSCRKDTHLRRKNKLFSALFAENRWGKRKENLSGWENDYRRDARSGRPSAGWGILPFTITL